MWMAEGAFNNKFKIQSVKCKIKEVIQHQNKKQFWCWIPQF